MKLYFFTPLTINQLIILDIGTQSFVMVIETA